MPAAAGPERTRVLDRIVEMIEVRGDGRLRIAVDGRTAAGKTSLGHELADALARRGRPVLRASLDDFKRPWSEAHLYDRVTGEGYYRNAFDRAAIKRLMLDPSGPTADGRPADECVALCSIDPLTQVDHSEVKTVMPVNAVLIVDGVFACHPQLDPYWDLRVWIDIDAELSVRRGTKRDADLEGSAQAAESLHRERYLVAESLYIDEVDPRSLAEVIVDNTDFGRPRLIRPAG
jgi:uridine kinase